MDDFEFEYIGDDEALEESANLNEDFAPRSVRINRYGKKVRGKDFNWVPKINFSNPRQFKESNILEDLQTNYSLKKKDEFEYGDVHSYVCKYSRKKRYFPCMHQYKIIFPSDSLEVIVEEANIHEHVLNPDFVDSTQVYRWTPQATDIIITSIKNGATPKVILRNLRDKGCFVANEEPSQIQLYNKISHLKKVLNLTESVDTTHQLRQKLANHMDEPDNDIEAYCAYANIQDDIQKDEETRVCVIFTTKRLLSFLSKSDTIHVDATYRLNWQRYPVMIVGVSNSVGKFYGSFTVLSSHEDSQTWTEIFCFIHSLNIHPKFRMSDGALSITKAGKEVFGSCELCKESKSVGHMFTEM